MKNRYKTCIVLLGIMLIFSFIPFSFYSEELTIDSKSVNSASFYGTWKVTELSWYNELYFASESLTKEMQQKIHKPIEDFLIQIEPESYAENSPNHDYKLEKPKYLLESYDMNTNSDTIYNSINGCRFYLESLNITDKSIEYLIVKDSIKDKMDSGEIDWYYISTPIFIAVDNDTLLLTSSECIEIFKCERISS